MSASTATLLWNSQTGTRNSDTQRTYAAVYQVATTDPLDGPQVVLDSGLLPTIYSFYSFGNDSDPSAVLKTITPARVDGNRQLWNVQCQWETPGTKKEDNDQNGKPTSDPAKWHDEIEIGHTKYQRPVTNAFYLLGSGYKKRPERDLLKRAVKGGPVCNSALVPFDPPLERDDSRQIIKITRWAKKYPTEWDKFIDKVNSSEWSINKPLYGYVRTFDKTTVKVNNIGGSFQFVNDIPIWKVFVELEFRADGWREKVLDRGIAARAEPGDADGLGGLIADFGQGGAPPGDALARRLLDKRGVPLSEPVLFDGDGDVLPPGLLGEPVYATWIIYTEEDFSPLIL